MLSTKVKKEVVGYIYDLEGKGYKLPALYSELYAQGYTADEIHAAMDYRLYHAVNMRITRFFVMLAIIVIIIGMLLLRFINLIR